MNPFPLLALGLLSVAFTTTAWAAEPKPWSQITTDSATASSPDQVDVRVLAIDGSVMFQRMTYRLTPGWHLLHIATTRDDTRHQPFLLMAEPCVQYDLVATHKSTVSDRRGR